MPIWSRSSCRLGKGASRGRRPTPPTRIGRWDAQHNLAASLSVVEARVVTNDYTLRYRGKSYQIARADLGGGLRGARVRVEQRLDGTVAVKFRDRYLRVSECPAGQKPKAVPVTAGASSTPRPAAATAVPAKLDGRVLPPGEPAAVEGAEAGRGTRHRPRGGPMRRRSRGALTPVALRAPSVSAPQNRNFLLCSKPELSTLP